MCISNIHFQIKICVSFALLFSGFPKTGQGKEEARIGENERKIWNQQRQVIEKRKTCKMYLCARDLWLKTLWHLQVV